MHPFYFFLVIGSLACGSLPSRDVDRVMATTSAAGLMIGLVLLAHVIARISAKQVVSGNMEPSLGAELFERQLGLFRWLGTGLIAFSMIGMGYASAWSVTPIQDPTLTDTQATWFSRHALMLLLPASFWVWGMLSAEHCYGVAAGYVETSITRYVTDTWRSFMSAMGLLVIPTLLVLLALDLSDALNFESLIGLGSFGPWAILASLAVALLTGMPLLMRLILKCERIELSEVSLDEGALHREISRMSVFRWRTGDRVYNAMVCGVFPWFRSVFISDRAIRDLSKEQLSMVVMHELAHVKRKHLVIRIASILPLWIGAMASTAAIESVLIVQFDLQVLDGWAGVIGTGLGVVATCLALRIISHWTEHDADRVACRFAVRNGVFASLAEAANCMIGTLEVVTSDCPATRKATWMHPSLESRRQSLHRMVSNDAASLALPTPL